MHPNHAPALIQEAIADAMPIIHDVIVKELHENPSVLLGQEAWDSLLNEARVYKEAEKVCRSSFDGITWGTDALKNSVEDFQCPNCSSSLLRNDNVNATIPSELRALFVPNVVKQLTLRTLLRQL